MKYIIQSKQGSNWNFKQQYSTMAEAEESMQFFLNQQSRTGVHPLRIITK